MRRVSLIIALSASLLSSSAYADIFGYIDEVGVGHFSTEKIDERYQLFLRGEQAFNSAQLMPADPAGSAAIKSPLWRYLSQHPNLKKYEALLLQVAQEFALDPALLKAVMAAESGFNAQAVSPKGAIGLMQLMPATAQRYGLQADKKQSIEQKLTDPKTNLRLAARYLRDLYQLFPSKLELVLASYNAGEGAVQKYQNQIPPYPETRNYVQLVSQFYQLYKPLTNHLASSSSTTATQRIHMTLPGRRSMPE